MAFETTATVLGAATQYRIAPEAKNIRCGTMALQKRTAATPIRGLEATPQSKEGFKLKITVAKDLQTFKMSITTANGLKAVNIFKDEQHKCCKKILLFNGWFYQPRVVCQSVSFVKSYYTVKGQEVCHSAKQARD